MQTVIVTGSSGLIGAEACRFFAGRGYRVVGANNDMRAYFFGPEAGTDWSRRGLEAELPEFTHVSVDIRDPAAMEQVFAEAGGGVCGGDPHRGAAVARLGGARTAHRFHG